MKADIYPGHPNRNCCSDRSYNWSLAATGHSPIQLNTSQPQPTSNNNKSLSIPNQPPVAYTISEPLARENQQHVYLNGSGEDPNGDKLSYSWRQTSGQPRVRIFNQTDPIASFSAPSNLTKDTNLTFELTVYDNRGMEDKSNTTVTVLNDRNSDAGVFIDEGYNLITLGRYKEAIDSLNKSLAIDPNNTRALDDKANALRSLGHDTEANKIEDKSLSLDKSDTMAMGNKAAILGDSRNYTGALRFYDKALLIDPNSTWTLNQKGLTLYSLQNYTGAIDVYDKALLIDPNYAKVQANKKLALDALKKHG